MAIIGKIREKSGWAVGAVAIGLLLFMVGGDIFSNNSQILNGQDNTVGVIDGEKISMQDFQKRIDMEVEKFATNYQRMPNEQESNQLKEQVWYDLKNELLFAKEYEKAGIFVGDEETVDMFQGKNIHEAVKQNFSNPETGQFDVEMVKRYFRQVDQMEEQNRRQLKNFEKALVTARRQEKFDNLMRLSYYVTSEEGKREYQAETWKADIKYVYIPYFSVSDSLITIKDSDLEEYMRENRFQYRSPNEYANLEYVFFDIKPSRSDSEAVKLEMAQIAQEFKETAPEKDSIFAARYSEGTSVMGLFSKDQLPAIFTVMDVDNMNDTVIGPLPMQRQLTIYKMKGKEQDTGFKVRASHILYKVEPNDDEAKKAAQKAKAEATLAKLLAGADFTMTANEETEDMSGRGNGGDLNYFGKGQMVKPFQDAVFNHPGVGVIPRVVESQFGYHLIKVTEPKKKDWKYKLYTIEKSVTAGDETRDSIYTMAQSLRSQVKDLASLKNLAGKDSSFELQKANRIMPTSKYVNQIQEAQAIVNWAFITAKEGQLSEVIEAGNGYVMVGLSKKVNKDEYYLEDNRIAVQGKVANRMKSKVIIEKLLSTAGATLEEKAKNYGVDAVFYPTGSVTYKSNSIPNVGFDPVVCGRVFSLPKPGAVAGPIAGENGVFMVELIERNEPGEIADYTQYQSQVKSRFYPNANAALEDLADLQDMRYKM